MSQRRMKAPGHFPQCMLVQPLQSVTHNPSCDRSADPDARPSRLIVRLAPVVSWDMYVSEHTWA